MTAEVRRQRIAAFLEQRPLGRLLAALNDDGEETRVVGGSVRDLLLGETVGDVDLATTALPEETMRRGRAAGFKPVPTGIEHGTITLVGDGRGFEVTTLRRDLDTDGRRATVAFGRDFVADAHRRDFTVNALSLGRDGFVHDYCGGLEDLAARRIRFIGDAGERIREDYLRILRFFRFHARFAGGPVDREGLAACIAGREGLDGLSRERVRSEIMKLLVARGAAGALRVMAEGGLLMPVIGRVPLLSRFAAIAGCDAAGEVHPAFRLAALAVTKREDALTLRERLRLSNAEFDRISRIAVALESVAGRVRPPGIVQLRLLAQAQGNDAVAAALVLAAARAPAEERRRCQALVAELGATPAFIPNGREVVARGVAAGPEIGRVLERARRLWIEAGAPAGEMAQLGFVDEAVSASGVAG